MRINGRPFAKQLFAQAVDKRSIINVGSPQQIIEKILYQHEEYGHQRYVGQMDFGGVPFKNVMKNLEILGSEIIPAVKKYTTPKQTSAKTGDDR